MFQHTAARRRLLQEKVEKGEITIVSTHSPPKAAATYGYLACKEKGLSTHSRPKAAATYGDLAFKVKGVSTHSRPKAAAPCQYKFLGQFTSFNTQPPEGGCSRYC